MEPIRKYPRLEGHDYNEGDYFVTVCCHDRKCLLGEIVNDKMILSRSGKCLDDNIRSITDHFGDVLIPEYVIMPNHFHAIVSIRNVVGSRLVATADMPLNLGKLNQIARLAVATGRDPTETTHFNSRLSVVVGSIKAAVTRNAKNNRIDFKWQSRFHEHIIRNSHDGNRISNYIIHNVSRWADDCFYNK